VRWKIGAPVWSNVHVPPSDWNGGVPVCQSGIAIVVWNAQKSANVSVRVNGASMTGSGRASAALRATASCAAGSPVVNTVSPATSRVVTPRSASAAAASGTLPSALAGAGSRASPDADRTAVVTTAT
jgi:hypothetical protein